MSVTSLAQARAELAGLLASDVTTGTPVSSLADLGVVNVSAREPMNPLKPVSVTLYATGKSPDFYQFELRVYLDKGSDVLKAQDDLDAVTDAVDVLVGSTGRWGPSAWTLGQTGEQDALLAVCRLERGREDF